jgi:hypothetical protein
VIVPTYGVVKGISKPGLARFGEPELIDIIRTPQGRHARDALLAATAKFEGAVLVTEDRRLTRRAEKIGMKVWNGWQLIEFIDGLLPLVSLGD